MHAPSSRPGIMPDTAPPVTVEDILGPSPGIVLPPDRDAIVVPLASTILSALPGIAPVAAGLGTLLFVPAGSGTTAGFEDECGAIVLLADPGLRREVDAALAPFGCRVPATAFLLSNTVHLRALLPIIRRLAAMREPGGIIALRSLAELLLHEIATAHSAAPDRPCPRLVNRLQPHHLRKIDRFIERNIEGVLRIDDLARLVGLSRYHFLRCFKRATGVSPMQYVLAARVDRARRLLAEGAESIAAIAYATGFSSQSHLNTTFKRHLGVTPGAFARAQRPGALTKAAAARVPAPLPALAAT